MKFIIGGAYQGKTGYAMKKYGFTESEIMDGENPDMEKIADYRCINNFHLFIKKIVAQGGNPIVAAEKILNENPDIIIIMNEIGNGIIPIEKNERIWREETGHTGCFLAEKSESVERIICGMPICIKEKED
jgi:hypothetical protein